MAVWRRRVGKTIGNSRNHSPIDSMITLRSAPCFTESLSSLTNSDKTHRAFCCLPEKRACCTVKRLFLLGVGVEVEIEYFVLCTRWLLIHMFDYSRDENNLATNSLVTTRYPIELEVWPFSFLKGLAMLTDKKTLASSRVSLLKCFVVDVSPLTIPANIVRTERLRVQPCKRHCTVKSLGICQVIDLLLITLNG